jgi:hypothetical protein
VSLDVQSFNFFSAVFLCMNLLYFLDCHSVCHKLSCGFCCIFWTVTQCATNCPVASAASFVELM